MLGHRLVTFFVVWREANKEAGQTLVEYAMIIAIVSVALVGALALLSTNIGNLFANIEALL